jgi:hypothetical protein
LPRGVLEAFRCLFYDKDDPRITREQRKATVVDGFTEYNTVDGTNYRVHPNFNNAGSWYDWAIIKCPHNNIDLMRQVEYRPRHTGSGKPIKRESIGRTGKGRKDVVVESTGQKKYGPGHVPAKVIALYMCPVDRVPKAIVHACRPWMQMNYNKSSTILECWHLQYKQEQDYKIVGPTKQRRKIIKLRPQYASIRADCLLERVVVFQETPGIHETIEDDISSGHVILVTDRREVWPNEFLEHAIEKAD